MKPSSFESRRHTPVGTLSGKSLFFCGLPEMPLQITTIPVLTFILNYYGSELGISLDAVGLVWMVWMVAMLIDGISDPVVGYASGRMVTRWGRRGAHVAACNP